MILSCLVIAAGQRIKQYGQGPRGPTLVVHHHHSSLASLLSDHLFHLNFAITLFNNDELERARESFQHFERLFDVRYWSPPLLARSALRFTYLMTIVLRRRNLMMRLKMQMLKLLSSVKFSPLHFQPEIKLYFFLNRSDLFF
jgi:hypothetical protein